jgi:hypothetical protein
MRAACAGSALRRGAVYRTFAILPWVFGQVSSGLGRLRRWGVVRRLLKPLDLSTLDADRLLLSRVTTPAILAIVYFLLFTSRRLHALFGRDALGRPDARATYRVARPGLTDSHGEAVLKLHFVGVLGGFMRERGCLWLAPIILLYVLLVALLVLAEGSSIAPFIYTLF